MPARFDWRSPLLIILIALLSLSATADDNNVKQTTPGQPLTGVLMPPQTSVPVTPAQPAPPNPASNTAGPKSLSAPAVTNPSLAPQPRDHADNENTTAGQSSGGGDHENHADRDRDEDSDHHHRRHFPNGGSTVVLPFGADGTFFYGADCLGNAVSLCGQIMSTPAGPYGSIAILTLPAPFQPQSFTVQCAVYNGVLSYQIIDAAQVTCAPQTCPTSSVQLCGASVPVPAGSAIGERINVRVPETLVTDGGSSMSFTAQCVAGQGASPVYQVTDDTNISCTHFPCPAANVRLCGRTIMVPGGTPLGEIMQMVMPLPFAPDPFAVQCIGSNGNPASYQVMDDAAVTCRSAK
jgi:hypothetical protein